MSPNELIEVSSRVNAAKDEPKTLPLLPLRNTVLFPHLFVPLSVGRPTSVAAVESALASEDKTFLVAAQKSTDNGWPESRGHVVVRASRRRVIPVECCASRPLAEQGVATARSFRKALQIIRMRRIAPAFGSARLS